MFVSLAQETFSFYDLDAVVRALNILADDCEMVIGMETPSGNRINSALALHTSTCALGKRKQKQIHSTHHNFDLFSSNHKAI